ncbi:hypothetical protein KI387_004780 [Taxus chinensis]|uniref:Phytocyanin domain-containing protein n=1 Tax=Taxus chinensis TaxID=29808 RepID=A0AA38GM57_TAXCH|nr:hypothetical protein KI387_004780 [Taxus chinensis]
MAISGISVEAKSLTLMLALVTFIYLLSSPVEARDIIVGGDNMWTLNGFNYTTWVEGEKFAVGDNLVFKYNRTAHDVNMVGGIAFKNCSAENSLASFSTGNDTVPLNMAGNMWFLCSFGQHCSKGMKFKITVLAAEPATAPTGDAPSIASAASTFMVVIFAVLGIFLL